MPTLLLVSANDPDNRLNQLSSEIKEIQRTLNKTYGKDYDVALTPDASIQDLIEELKIPHREIEVLHYAGHADSTLIQLSDGDADADALAEKLQRLQSLKLVFLNGCATRGQVDFFHGAGIPFVIATSCKIGDDKAFTVATQLYQYLCLGRSLRDACREVETDVRKLHKKVDFVADRGLALRGEDLEADFPWGLYIKPGAEADDYRLPFARPLYEGSAALSHSTFLNNLIRALAKLEGVQHLENIRDLAPDLNRGMVPDDSKLEELLAVLPLTLGIRLRKILAKPNVVPEDHYLDMLYNYAFFFESLLQHCAAILIAHAWQYADRLPPALKERIKSYLQLNQTEISMDNYPPLIQSLMDWLDEEKIDSVMIPLKAESLTYLQSSSFQEAADLFFLHKKIYKQKLRLKEEEAVESCFLAQKYLNEAFTSLRFLMNFTMVSVQDIEVVNLRYVNYECANILSKLVFDKAKTGIKKGTKMLENRSVLCFLDTNYAQNSPSLNLFPFVLDRNVFIGNKNELSSVVDVYLFAGYFCPTGEKQAYFHFISVEKPNNIWRLSENDDEISLRHVNDPPSSMHDKHLMTNSGELKYYLDHFKTHFLNA